MNKPSVIIVHGTMGSPEINWFPWLKAQLEKRGCAVFVPRFPTPEGQDFEAWAKIFRDIQKDMPCGETILIGHSLAPAFLFRMAEEAAEPYKALISVCPFVGAIGNKEYDDLNDSFVSHQFDWTRIRQNAGEIICYAGDNDPYVPLHMPQGIAKNIDVPLQVITRGGHLNAEFGYTEFPELLEKVEGLLG